MDRMRVETLQSTTTLRSRIPPGQWESVEWPGNFFVIKAVGAASEKGAGFDELVRIGNKSSPTKKPGVSRSAPALRQSRKHLFESRGRDGSRAIGIHGEPGRQRTKLVSATRSPTSC